MKGFTKDGGIADGRRGFSTAARSRARVTGRTGAALLSAAALATGVAVASPAQAAPVTCAADAPCETAATFDVTAGVLEITVPDTADLGTGTPGSAITGSLGAVSVSDQRASTTPNWTASVISTDFTTGAGGTGQVVPATSITYASGTVTPGAGQTGTCNASTATPLDNTTPITAASHTGGSGNNTCSWNPTLVVTVATTNVAGTYSGTVTHSVTGV
ncbi:hypothetical protein [Micromonospora sp. NPDC050200]|uniref:hypothetical protein n=1 Tax=Micromonospora sp. NPDC050200 TaxID=3155664 RepID=UPI0033E4E6DE